MSVDNEESSDGEGVWHYQSIMVPDLWERGWDMMI